MKRYILVLGWLVVMLSPYLCYASEDTVDISYILPNNGKFDNYTLDTLYWTLEWDMSTNASSTAFFCVNCTGNGESYVTMRIFKNDTQTYGAAKMEIFSNITSLPLDISTVKWQQLIVNVIGRGNPDPTYGGGTIFGYLQGSAYSAYYGNATLYRTPGVSPGYFEATGFKPLTILDPSTTGNIVTHANYAIYAITTSWTIYTWRFIPIHQNWFKIGYFALDNAGDPFLAKPGPLFNTDIQIKQIILQAIRIH